MERIEEIRARVLRAKQPHKVSFTISKRQETSDVSGIGLVYLHAPADLEFLLAEVARQAAQLARIKAALMAVGCSDYTDDVARMAEEFLAQEKE